LLQTLVPLIIGLLIAHLHAFFVTLQQTSFCASLHYTNIDLLWCQPR